MICYHQYSKNAVKETLVRGTDRNAVSPTESTAWENGQTGNTPEQTGRKAAAGRPVRMYALNTKAAGQRRLANAGGTAVKNIDKPSRNEYVPGLFASQGTVFPVAQKRSA